LDNIELSEAQFSSIKFVWKVRDLEKVRDFEKLRDLEKVIVSLTNGRTIEFPLLKAPNGEELYLEGNTNVNGFSGRFSKILSTRASEHSEVGTIVEIKIK
jgi:hypothetical protein